MLPSQSRNSRGFYAETVFSREAEVLWGSRAVLKRLAGFATLLSVRLRCHFKDFITKEFKFVYLLTSCSGSIFPASTSLASSSRNWQQSCRRDTCVCINKQLGYFCFPLHIALVLCLPQKAARVLLFSSTCRSMGTSACLYIIYLTSNLRTSSIN